MNKVQHPQNWQLTKLREIAASVPNAIVDGPFGSNLKLSDYVEEGVPVLQGKNITNDRFQWFDIRFISKIKATELKRSSVRVGDILLVKIGSIGFSAIIQDLHGFDFAIIPANLAKITPDPSIVDTKYLHKWLTSPDAKHYLVNAASKTAQPALSLSKIKDLPVILPPLKDQRRIAEILDRAEEIRSKRREAIAQLDTLTQAIFLEMFGDPVRNPKGWVKMPFGEVCVTRLGKMLDKQKQTGEYRRMYLRNANVQWFRFNLTDIFEMDFRASECKILRLQYGDLLICEGGEPGRAAIWRDEIPECYYQKTLHRARPKNDLANSEYLAYLLWLLSKGGGLNDHITSSTISHLTGEKLKVMKIPIPPIDLQQKFAHRIEAVEKLKAVHRASLSELDALFASLQHRTFKGDL